MFHNKLCIFISISSHASFPIIASESAFLVCYRPRSFFLFALIIHAIQYGLILNTEITKYQDLPVYGIKNA